MKYTAEITFETNRHLTDKELINMMTALSLQVQEPMNETGLEEEYVTKNIIKRLKIDVDGGVYYFS